MTKKYRKQDDHSPDRFANAETVNMVSVKELRVKKLCHLSFFAETLV